MVSRFVRSVNIHVILLIVLLWTTCSTQREHVVNPRMAIHFLPPQIGCMNIDFFASFANIHTSAIVWPMNGRVTSDIFQTKSLVLFHVQNIKVLCCFSAFGWLHIVPIFYYFQFESQWKNFALCVEFNQIDFPEVSDKSTKTNCIKWPY